VGTRNVRTLPLSATGSAEMEAARVNTVPPGEVVVVAVNGLMGRNARPDAAMLVHAALGDALAHVG
jgi:aspartate aminotransferase-like enzyme